MIIVRLVGGLGNQMFQYALAKKLSLKNGTNIVFDFSLFRERNRPYALGCFDLQYKMSSEYGLKLKPNNFWRRLFYCMKSLIIKDNIIYYREKTLEYDENIWALCGDVCIDGYWQSEKYFLDIRKDILNEYKIKRPLCGKNIITAKKIRGAKTAVSLHVRRGDYVTNKNANIVHGLCTLDYYYKGIDYLEKIEGALDIFIFSDDIAWAKENIKVGSVHTLHFVDNNSEEYGYEDMRLMSMCRHNIIANSSFSWWGAWLNDNDNKIVIAPSEWFKDKNKISKDIIPETWIKL